jgi:hypothetical protein
MCCSTNFIFRELWAELKSLVIQSLLKNRNSVQARLRAIELSGDRQLPRTAVQFLNLESILPLTNGLCVFLATVKKISSRTQGRYGRLTNV